MLTILQRNLKIRDHFYEILDDKDLTKEKIYSLSTTTFGTKTWSDYSHNINDSAYACPNGCVYCYIKSYGTPLKVTKTLKVNKKKVHRRFGGFPKNKVVMFPTAHDIFMSCVADYITAAKNILTVGLDLLIVSKPRLPVIKRICRELRPYRKQVEFRFTICTDDPDLKTVWEPYAPEIPERIACTKYAHSQGYRTSISMEPLLSDPTKLIKLLDPYVSSFWIGHMNHVGNIDIEDIHKKNVMLLKSPEFVLDLVYKLKKNKKVFWKESVIKFVQSELAKNI